MKNAWGDEIAESSQGVNEWGDPIAPPAAQAPATPAFQKVDAGGSENIFPEALRAYENRMTKPAGSIGQSVADIGAVAASGLKDLSNYEQRVFGSLTGKTDITDPEGGYRKNTREAYRNWYKDRINEVSQSGASDAEKQSALSPAGWERWAKVRGLQLGDVLSQGWLSFTEAPITFGAVTGAKGITAGVNALKRAIPGAKNMALRYGSLQGEKSAVERAATPQGRLELSQATRETPDALASEAAQGFKAYNQGEEAATIAAEAARQGRLDASIRGQAQGGVLDPYSRGKQIESAAQEGKTTLGKLFQAEQDRVLRETGVEDKTLRWKKKKGIPGITPKASESPLENPLQRSVLEYLDEIKYDPFKGYGVVGNRTIDPGAINELKGIYKMVGKARNTRDALDIRRLIDNRINFGGDGNSRLFAKGSDSDFAVNSVRDRINDVVEKQFKRAIKDPKEAEAFSAAWRANNEHYSAIAKTLGDAADKLGPKNAEQYLGAIKSIGVDRLKGVLNTAAKYPEMASVANELRAGYLDNLIHRSTKDGRIDFGAFKKMYQWEDSKAFNQLMLSPVQRANIEKALTRFEKTNFPEAREAGKFFEGGKSDIKTASDVLSNISTYDKRYALKELEFLDAITGRTGDQKLSFRAMAMSQGRKLGIDEKGSLSKIADIATGKFNAGLISGGSTGAATGAAVAGPIGAAVGAPIGALLGATTQSPAGIVFAFRILNKIQGTKFPGLDELSKRAFQSAAAREVIRRDAVAVPNTIPFRIRDAAENELQPGENLYTQSTLSGLMGPSIRQSSTLQKMRGR